MAGSMLPPVIVRIIGDDGDLLRTLAEAKAALVDFAKNDYRAKLLATLPDLLRSLEQATAAAQAFSASHPIEMQAELPGLSPLAAKLIAEVNALQATASAHPIEIPITTSGGFLSGLGGGLSAGIGGLLGSILPMLVKPGGGGGGILGGIPGLGGIAGALPGGLIPAAAGLGTESLIIGPLMGLVGSMIGAAVGAGFLGLGAGGVGAVGFGTNAAGIGQGISDIQKYQTALAQLNTAVATYGPTSIQAAQAQAHLTAVMKSFPAAVQGVTGPIAKVSATLTQMATLWDKATGGAEAKGLHIITEFLHVIEKFFTTIGKFSTENMSILTKGLKPLFHWLGTTGLKIFTNLEKVFQKNMPKGITAMVNGIELLFKIITDVAPHLGHFVTMIAGFLKKLNTSTQGKLKAFITTMIGDFQAWFGFIKQLVGLGKTVLPLVAHLGTMMVKTIFTPMIESIRSFVQQNSGILKQFFTSHKNLIGGIGTVIKSLMPIVGQLILGFVGLANALRPLTTVGLKQVAALIKDLDTVFMIIADFLSGNISGGVSQAVKFGGHIAHQAGAGQPPRAPGIGHAASPVTVFKNLYHYATSAVGWLTHLFTGGSAGASTLPGGGGNGHTSPTTLIAGLLGTSESQIADAATQIGKMIHNLVSVQLKAKTLAKDFDQHFGSGLIDSAGTAKSNAAKLGTDVHTAVRIHLQAPTLAKDFDTNLAAALKAHASLAKTDAQTIGTDIHNAVKNHLQAPTLGKDFDTHLGAALLANIGDVRTTARQVGTGMHDAVFNNMHAEELGKVFDEHLAASITANDSVVIAAAKQLAQKAGNAFSTTASNAFITRLKAGTVMR